ncbi:hypothetical protein Moror_1637, partial [Moniliophthora roreri MCA 2997]
VHFADAVDAQITGSRTKFINQGLKIESIQRQLKALVAKGEADPTEVVKQRAELRAQIAKWRVQQVKFTPSLEKLILSLLTVATPEKEELYLPSSFVDAAERSRYTDPGLVFIECKLRRGQAYDSLRDLKYVLKHSGVLVRTKRQHSRGVTFNLRSTKLIREVSSKKTSWIQKYIQARVCLMRLGDTTGNADSDFPELKDEDMWMPAVGEDAVLGEGSRDVRWIWKKHLLYSSKPEMKETVLEQLESVPWFRAKADMHRWLEEVELLEEEFRRFACGCDKMKETWERLAVLNTNPAYAAYAHHKADMYAQMATEAKEKLVAAGGGWPGDNQTLIQYLRTRRPQLNVDWSQIQSQPEVPVLQDYPSSSSSDSESE